MRAETASAAFKEHHPEPPVGDLPAFADSNHHLWWNRNTLWVAFCVIHDGYRQERIRMNLRTSDMVVARERRDALFAQWNQHNDAKLSLRLRYPHPRKRVA